MTRYLTSSGWVDADTGEDEPGPIRRRLRWLAERWYFLYLVAAVAMMKLAIDGVEQHNYVVGGINTVCSIVFVALTFVMDNLRRARVRRQATASPWLEVKEVAKPWQKDEWCVDCGTRAVPFRYQNGFQLVTGEPAYRRVRGCPNWDGDMTPRGDPVLVMAFAGGLSSKPPVYTCGNKVTTAPEIELKHNHDEANVSLDCELCLINMESARVMSKDDVTARIAALHG